MRSRTPAILARCCARRTRGTSAIQLRNESTSTASTWEPALAPGVNPAYDAALSYLAQHQSDTLAKLSQLPDPSSPEAQQLEIEAYINDPAIRRRFRETNGRGEMDKVVMRSLAESSWRKQGGLDLLMQRVHQLGVVPDLLPEITSTSPLTVSSTSEIEPGSFVAPSTFASPPRLTFQPFSDTTPSLHTLLVIDLDSPSHETQSYTERVHYLKSDIPLSALSGDLDLFASASGGTEHLSWEPLAPAQGSGKHRYVFIVLQHASPSSSKPTSRENFSLRTFIEETSAVPAGITLVRAKYSAEEEAYIDKVYSEYRGGPAPVYGKSPKEMRYGYPMSSKALRADGIRNDAWEKMLDGFQVKSEE
ncbi:large subunit ribosomal protein L35, partial [Tremellales sp. Uapishka_1]